MNSKTILFFFILSIFLLSGVYAQSVPFTTKGDSGYFIEFADTTPIGKLTNHSFHFHVYNITNGLPIYNSSMQCNAHIYDNTGEHIFKEYNLKFDGREFEINPNMFNFSHVGEYALLVFCNNSNTGGFLTYPFEVNGEGIGSNTGGLTIFITAIALFILFSILSFIIGINVINMPVKLSLIMIGFVLFLIPLNLISVALSNEVINPRIINFFDSLTAISFIMAWAIGFMIIIVWIITLFNTYFYSDIDKKINGINPDSSIGGIR